MLSNRISCGPGGVFLSSQVAPKKTEILTPLRAMQWAISEAWQGVPTCAPNPPVGCVILSQAGEFLASGFHRIVGEPHAEIEALKNFFEVDQIPRKNQDWDLSSLDLSRLKNAIVFVTLEPCSFVGRTPSCASTLAKLPISRVVVGALDPNPKVSGQGMAYLSQSGIEISRFNELIDSKETEIAFKSLIEVFHKNILQQQCFFAGKIASSLDGYFVMKSGESQWITGPQAREAGGLLRAQYDAIMVGHRTICKDNPNLNVRYLGLQDLKKKIIILDPLSQLDLNRDFNFKKHFLPENTFVVNSLDAPPLTGVQQLKISLKGAEFNLDELKMALWKNEIRSVYVEGGGLTLSSFLNSDLIDRLYVFQAPSLIGGEYGRSWSEGLRTKKLSDQKRMIDTRVCSIGQDILVTGLFKPHN